MFIQSGDKVCSCSGLFQFLFLALQYRTFGTGKLRRKTYQIYLYFKLFFQRVACPIHNGTFISFVWLRRDEISMSLSLKIDSFQLWILCKSSLQYFANETMQEVVKVKHCSGYTSDYIFRILSIWYWFEGYRCESSYDF